MPDAQILRFPTLRRAAAGFRLPGPRDRLAIIGRTGSGKTHFAAWALSLANWPRQPWVIIDYKRDELLRDLPVEQLAVEPRRLPHDPGLYIVHPRPDEELKVEKLLWRIWERGRTGLYVDEGHILPDAGGLQAILTQGRSKYIPVIVLTQRPKWLNRFVFSEADYYALFHLNDKRDKQTVGEFLPEQARYPLPPRNAWYYDVAHDELVHLLPVPDRAAILANYQQRNPGVTRARMI